MEPNVDTSVSSQSVSSLVFEKASGYWLVVLLWQATVGSILAAGSVMEPILYQFIHPALERSRINRQLLDCALELEAVRVNDLYEAYPHFDIDVEREKALMESHETVVFQFPLYWYSSPALLKEWFDLVLQYGWAYGKGAGALVGKKAKVCVTMGGPANAYTAEGNNKHTMEEFLLPFESTFTVCGMDYGEPFYVHNALHLSGAEFDTVLTNYKHWLLEG